MHRSTKSPLRIVFASALWLTSIASAFAQVAPDITLELSPAQVAEIMRLVDLQPIGKAPPPAFWDLQRKIQETLRVNPKALRAVQAAWSAER